VFLADIYQPGACDCAPLPHGVFFYNYVKNIVHEFKQQIIEISEAVTLEMLKHVWSEACYQLHICHATKGVCVGEFTDHFSELTFIL